jgi:glucosamine-phosphate N-acetyltransferase
VNGLSVMHVLFVQAALMSFPKALTTVSWSWKVHPAVLCRCYAFEEAGLPHNCKTACVPCVPCHADTSKSRIIGTASLIVERKFLRRLGKVCVQHHVSSAPRLDTYAMAHINTLSDPSAQCGHIEDVVVDNSYRGQRLGQRYARAHQQQHSFLLPDLPHHLTLTCDTGHRLINALCDAAQELGCYKVILDCSEANVPFYEKCGLTRKEVQMVREHAYTSFTLACSHAQVRCHLLDPCPACYIACRSSTSASEVS